MTEEKKSIEVGRWWRVLLISDERRYVDVWGVLPQVDEHGMLGFFNVAKFPMGVFAPGTWLAVTPVRSGEQPPED